MSQAETRRPLHMMQVYLSTPAVLALGQRYRLPIREVDLGYLVHLQLRQIFGTAAPQPFSVRGGRGRWLKVLGYCEAAENELKRNAAAFADAEAHAAVDWRRLALKGMPTLLPIGTILGFSVRVCPVVRTAHSTDYYKKGAEVDAFLTRCASTEGASPSRDHVYREWLSEQVDRRGGATILASRMEAFGLERVTRRTQGRERRVRVRTQPSVTISGRLQVEDSSAFTELLRRGVGRHRAFGFGMLLLRPLG